MKKIMLSLVVLSSVILFASCGASPSAPTVVPTHRRGSDTGSSYAGVHHPWSHPYLITGRHSRPTGLPGRSGRPGLLAGDHQALFLWWTSEGSRV